MSTAHAPAPRQHASTGPAQPQLPEPSHAERSRTLLSLVSVGMLIYGVAETCGLSFWVADAVCYGCGGATDFFDQQYGDAYAEPAWRSAMQLVCYAAGGGW